MILFRRYRSELPIISKSDALSFIQNMANLAKIPGSNIKGIKITHNGKDQIIGMKIVANDNEMRLLRKRLPREGLFILNRRF